MPELRDGIAAERYMKEFGHENTHFDYGVDGDAWRTSRTKLTDIAKLCITIRILLYGLYLLISRSAHCNKSASCKIRVFQGTAGLLI